MIDFRTRLVESFRDTQARVKEDPALAEATLRMQAGTQLYLADYRAVARPHRSDGGAMEVVEDTSFHCARGLLDGGDRVAVLNFANAFSPGGGVTRGAMAQEECLCRSSNLYSALTLPYMLKNYYKHNARTVGDMGSDAVIYSPGVTVFKSDDAVPVPLDEPFRVDVITCAAPYVNPGRARPVDADALQGVLERRIRNILEVAAASGAESLVLGAFGCGAFNNPPELVAEAFRQNLEERGLRDCFRRVAFAIKANDRANTNLLAFRKALA